jgi:hypothetical protein
MNELDAIRHEIEARQARLDRAAGATEDERIYTRWRWELQELASRRRENLHRLLEARAA